MKVATAVMAALAAFAAAGAEGAEGGAPPTPFRARVAFVAGFPEGSEKSAQVKRFAASFLDSHAGQFGFASKTRPGPERYRVYDAAGAVVYEGGDEREAEAAVVNALTDMPVPGQLISGVDLRKFKRLEKTFVMGKVKAEGAALAPIRAALKSKKPGEAEEAQAILDSIERAKKNLEAFIEAGLKDGGDKGMLLRDVNWFCRTWPSEKAKYAEELKRLMADPEAVKGAKELMKPPKRRR